MKKKDQVTAAEEQKEAVQVKGKKLSLIHIWNVDVNYKNDK